MDKHILLEKFIEDHPQQVGRVVDYSPSTDSLFTLDFTAANTELQPADVNDTEKFSTWVSKKLRDNNCRYGIGGYMEHRTLYARSELFNTGDEPRRLHLGIDIWAGAGTPVYVPLAGRIHSFRNNDHFGDYGPTIIVEHALGQLTLYSLYGHLNKESMIGLTEGDSIPMGKQIGVFGNQQENGHWPPHLHFQLMFDMEGCHGDYPGVGYNSRKNEYLKNIPDPNLILQFP